MRPHESLAELRLLCGVGGPAVAGSLSKPAELVSWYDAVFLLAHGAEGPVDWRRVRRRDIQRKEFRRLSDEVFHACMADFGHSDSCRQQAVERLSRLTRQNLRMADAVAADDTLLGVWIEHYESAATLLRQLGCAGQLPTAVVIDEAGVKRTITAEAWANSRNWEMFTSEKVLAAGDIPFSPPGTPQLPVALVTSWFKLFERHQCLSLRSAEDLLLGPKRPDEGWKDWLTRQGVTSQILLEEALSLAPKAKLGARDDELLSIAKTLQETARRNFPKAPTNT